MSTASLNSLRRDLDRLKANAVAGDTDIRTAIVQGRSQRRPKRTRAALDQMALETGMVGRMARADLRINRIGLSNAPIEPGTELAQQMGDFRDDPLGFVLWAFEWGADPSMRVVRLPEPWSTTYASEFGPDAWACELLEDIGRQVRERAFDGAKAVDAVRAAVASGHGIGKSAVTA